MDFMKAIDQTVREIKREVNLKVLKVPEIEQKVLDATDDEPWGPHGTILAEIAQATKKFSECPMVMNVLWARLAETDRNWRHVYKALAVVEYLVANGSERAVDDIIEHTYQISSLSSFEYVEPNGKDSGLNVRKKAENIAALLNDKDKIQHVRNKAAANRNKYVGLSSSGITFKPGSASLSSSNFQSSDRYGGFGNTRDGETFKSSFKEREQSSGDKFEPGKYRPRRGANSTNLESTTRKGPSRHDRTSHDSSATGASKKSTIKDVSDEYSKISSQSMSTPSNNNDYDDDFDPRGTSNSKAAPVAGNSPQVDFFGQDFTRDLLDVPESMPTEKSKGNSIDLFADAAFVSAGATSGSETKVDLFASQPATSAVSPALDLFAAPEPVVQPDTTSTKPTDPFAAVPLNHFDDPDEFASFSFHTGPAPTEPSRNFMDGGNLNNPNENTSSASIPPSKKEGFQVKSGVWADSLSRGLIDLNISGPKKVDLLDVGIVGGLSDASQDKYKGQPTSFCMGRAMGTGSGHGGLSTADGRDDLFSGQQFQYGGGLHK